MWAVDVFERFFVLFSFACCFYYQNLSRSGCARDDLLVGVAGADGARASVERVLGHDIAHIAQGEPVRGHHDELGRGVLVGPLGHGESSKPESGGGGGGESL